MLYFTEEEKHQIWAIKTQKGLVQWLWWAAHSHVSCVWWASAPWRPVWRTSRTEKVCRASWSPLWLLFWCPAHNWKQGERKPNAKIWHHQLLILCNQHAQHMRKWWRLETSLSEKVQCNWKIMRFGCITEVFFFSPADSYHLSRTEVSLKDQLCFCAAVETEQFSALPQS